MHDLFIYSTYSVSACEAALTCGGIPAARFIFELFLRGQRSLTCVLCFRPPFASSPYRVWISRQYAKGRSADP